ncbi:MAG: hypothetical protein IKG27_06155 [Bacilli bacterium]|nr:hypothetical protein [Bacilli bacterium]
MYKTIEFYDNNGCDLKEVLKSCIYKYYIENKNLLINKKSKLETDEKSSIIKATNKVKKLSNERSKKCTLSTN